MFPSHDLGGGKGDSPDPPDYKGAAEAEAAANQEMLEYQTVANRPTQYTPWGTISWEQQAGQDGSWDYNYQTKQWEKVGDTPPTWTQTVELSPQQQASLDSQFALQEGRSGLALSLLGRAEDEFGAPMDWSQFTEFGGVPQSAAMTDLLRNYDFSGAHEVGDPASIRQAAEDAIYNKAASRLDYNFGNRANDLEVKLRNQGLRPGDEIL